MMTKHKFECKKFDKSLSEDGPPKKRAKVSNSGNQPLMTKFIGKQATTEENTATTKLLKALISTSTPFAILNDPFVREPFDYVKLLC